MGRGDSPSRNWNALQNALLLIVSALWMGSAVIQIDDTREAQLSRRASCCCARFSGLLPSWRAVIDRRRLVAVAFGGVSLGLRQDCAQADVISHLPAGVVETYIGAELGPLLAEACAGGPIEGPELLWGAGHCHIGKGG